MFIRVITRSITIRFIASNLRFHCLNLKFVIRLVLIINVDLWLITLFLIITLKYVYCELLVFKCFKVVFMFIFIISKQSILINVKITIF